MLQYTMQFQKKGKKEEGKGKVYKTCAFTDAFEIIFLLDNCILLLVTNHNSLVFAMFIAIVLYHAYKCLVIQEIAWPFESDLVKVLR